MERFENETISNTIVTKKQSFNKTNFIPNFSEEATFRTDFIELFLGTYIYTHRHRCNLLKRTMETEKKFEY
jgi:hypothetical protein